MALVYTRQNRRLGVNRALGSDPLVDLYDPVVRDLAWALSSPQLLAPGPDCLNYQQLYTDFSQTLRNLDAEPTILHDSVMAQRAGRLGLYFEALWQFWLAHNQDYALRAHNVQIQTDGITQGELDLIVQDQRSNELQHWELAVKFYLGLGDTRTTAAWIGPNAKDRLDRKLQHLNSHQLPLLHRADTQSQLTTSGWSIHQQRLILKGRLFYPLRHEALGPIGVSADHLRGWWASQQDFFAHFKTATLGWQPLSRQHWLAPLRREAVEQLQTAEELLKNLNIQHALCVAGFADGDECTRGFIVGRNWPNSQA